MTSSDAGATSSSIISLIVLSPMPTLSLALSLTLSPVSTTSGNLIHRQFAGGQLSRWRSKLLVLLHPPHSTLRLAHGRADRRRHALPRRLPGFTHQTALIAEPARQPRALVWKQALSSAPI